MDNSEGKAVRGRVPKRKGGEPTAVSMTEPPPAPPQDMVKSGKRPVGTDEEFSNSHNLEGPLGKQTRPNEMTHEELLVAAKEYARLLLAEDREKRRLEEKLRGAQIQKPVLHDDEGFQEPELARSSGPPELKAQDKYPVRTATATGAGLNLLGLVAINMVYSDLYGENMPVWMFAAVLAFLAAQALLVWIASNKVTANAVLERLRG